MPVAGWAVVVFVATLAWRLLAFTGFTNDHYAHLALAQQMLLGDVPVRDFVDPGWPLTYLTSAAAWRLFGNAMAVEWSVAALAFATAAACTLVAAYWLSRSLSIALLVTAAEIAIFPRTYGYPKLLPYAVGAVILLAVAARPSAWRLILTGAAVAVAFLLRHDHGLYLGVAAIVCVTLTSRSLGMRAAARRSAIVAAAALVALLPWMLFVMLNGGLGFYFDTALEFARGEANASNLRAWPRLQRVPGRPLLGLARPDRPLVQVEWRDGIPDAERQRLEQQYGLEFERAGDDSRFYYPHDPTAATLAALDDDPRVDGTTGLARAQRPRWREWLAAASPLRVAPALHSRENADAWLFWLFWSLPALCGLLLVSRVVRGHETWRGETAAVAALVVVALFVNAGFLRDVLRTRFSDAIVPPALLGAWVLGLVWVRSARLQADDSCVRSARLQAGLSGPAKAGHYVLTRAGHYVLRAVSIARRAASIVILIATGAAIASVSDFRERWERTGIVEGLDGVRARFVGVTSLLAGPHRQSISPPSYASAALMPFFDYVDRCSSDSERIIVTGEFPDIVVLAGRRFASDGVVMGAWYSSAVHQRRTVEGLAVQPPLFIVYIDAAPFRRRYPEVERYVAEHYRGMATLTPDGADGIPILVDRRRAARTTDAATGWPCYR